jgi:hypothetical protein
MVGILKMGYKNLFVRVPPPRCRDLQPSPAPCQMANSSFRELCPLCCLDFYVHSSIQR